MNGRIAALAAFIAFLFVASATTATPAQGVSTVPPPVVAGIDLERATIPDLQQAMDAGRLSSVQLTELYLQRIGALNPMLHAVITTNPPAVPSDATPIEHRFVPTTRRSDTCSADTAIATERSLAYSARYRSASAAVDTGVRSRAVTVAKIPRATGSRCVVSATRGRAAGAGATRPSAASISGTCWCRSTLYARTSPYIRL